MAKRVTSSRGTTRAATNASRRGGTGTSRVDSKRSSWTQREARAVQSYTRVLNAVATAANTVARPEAALQVAIDQVCRLTGWPVGHVYVPASDGTPDLEPTSLWCLEDPARFEVFREVTERTRFAPGRGLPGRVLSSGQPAWIVDVTRDSNFPRARLATNLGVRGAFAFPVLVDDDVVAVLEFFSSRAKAPDKRFLELMAQVGVQLGTAIERNRTAQRLHESEIRKGAIFEAALDCIITMDASGIVTEFNPAAERTFGYSREDVVGKPLAEIVIPARLREAHARGLARHLQTGESRVLGKRVEMTAVRADGGEFPVELTITQLDVGGTPTFTGFVRDLTSAKALEEQFLQAQKMEAVGQLAAGVAHDFNNLLSSILGFSHAQLRKLPAGDPMRRPLELIFAAGKRGEALVREMLAFARPRQARHRVIDVNAVVEAMSPLLGRLLNDDVELRIKPGPAGTRTKADRGQLEQALMNLAVNARDAMPDGGVLTIETGVVAPDEADASGHVVISVSDTGCGMDAPTRARIFEPFFTTKEPGKGTGLGLATVLRMVTDSGGQVSVVSEPGLGTSFRIQLPLSGPDVR